MPEEALRQQNKILTLQRVTGISDKDNDVDMWYETNMHAWTDLHKIDDKKGNLRMVLTYCPRVAVPRRLEDALLMVQMEKSTQTWRP
ncbi:hypothetical protein BCR36DRAFT_441502 [Piromyces finnis]|uniref:Uncharacterized protein n=1 Tax=Piromyces finnis TaxID=1754191 RepID=A0A1Y1UPN8_9FUNG|nr:hypothetical protein BCR36DRAFT_441502 [Piromyces finnis]|eukprot:ORX39474.1 hypothetical protein BCR36DRAFT_441502 [Piromyces finnis]